MKKVAKINRVKQGLIAGIIGVFGLCGCDDVIEDNITNDSIVVVSPNEGELITSNVVAFQWNHLDGADEYRVQISNENNAIIEDSLVLNNYLNYPLTAGDYSWRVRGENFAYVTAYSFQGNFQVESSNDLTNQIVVLNSPNDNIYINGSAAITTTWTGISNADSYTFELLKNPGNLVVFNQSGITSNLYTIETSVFTEDAEYIWSVKALNDTTETETSYASRTFFLDSQNPNVPVLSNPADNTFILLEDEVTFVWENGQDTGNIQSEVTSKLQLATDIGFTDVIQEYVVTANSQVHSFTEIGDYYWRLKNKDEAGNESDLSDTRKITVE